MCNHFFGGKLALAKGWPHFLDPFDIGAATFLEISISNSIFYIWNGINFRKHDLFPYLDFNYVILWPQMETNIKVEFSGGIT